MIDEERLPETEAAPEIVQDSVADAAPETTDVVVSEEQSAEAEAPDSPPEDTEEQQRSKSRRERRKQYVRELESKTSDVQARLERIKSARDEAPKEEDFDDLTEFAAAKAVWMASDKQRGREIDEITAEQTKLQEQRQREIEAEWTQATAAARTRLQNFDQVIGSIPAEHITPQVASVIKTADNGPDVAYKLGSDPALAMRIASMSEAEQVFELGRLSASLTAPKPITQSNAPDPIKPVGGQSRVQKDPSKMSNAEYRLWREKGGGR